MGPPACGGSPGSAERPAPGGGPARAGRHGSRRARSLSGRSGVDPEDGFPDVPEGSTHEAAVDCIVHYGLAEGHGGNYVPARQVSREQASFITRRVSS